VVLYHEGNDRLLFSEDLRGELQQRWSRRRTDRGDLNKTLFPSKKTCLEATGKRVDSRLKENHSNQKGKNNAEKGGDMRESLSFYDSGGKRSIVGIQKKEIPFIRVVERILFPSKRRKNEEKGLTRGKKTSDVSNAALSS